jgi:hypothetical protein
VSESAKENLWKVESERYAMTMPELQEFNPYFLELNAGRRPVKIRERSVKAIQDAWPLFLSLDMFFVKVCIALHK